MKNPFRGCLFQAKKKRESWNCRDGGAGGGQWWINRGTKGMMLFWLDVGGWGGVNSYLQCSAGLHHPITSQLSVKGAGPEADGSQGEFSVRVRERERERVKQLCFVLYVSTYSRASKFLFFLFVSSPPPSSHVILTFWLSSIVVSSSSSFHSPSFCLSPFWFSICSFFLLVDGVRGFFFLTPALAPVLPPSPPMGIRASSR